MSTTEELFRKIHTGTPLFAGEHQTLAAHGLPEDYRTYPHDEAVYRLYAAGFALDQILFLMEGRLEADKTMAYYEAALPELPVITRLHAQGMTPLQISEYLDVPRTTVYYHLYKLGLTPHRSNAAELTISQQRKIEALADRGLKYADIAARVGCSYDQVRDALRREHA